MNYKIVQFAALVLASASLFGADEYVGGQVPIVFAGPRHGFYHDYLHDPHELVDGRFFGVESYIGKVDDPTLYPIYDAGSPKLVTSILIQGGNQKGGGNADTDAVNSQRVGNFRVYGSNDMQDWELFWEGHSHTISANWLLRIIRNPETGVSTAYKLECSKTPTMSTAEVLDSFDDSTYPTAKAYRYYKIEPSPKSDYRTINACEFSLWSPELLVSANRPTVYSNAEQLDTADDVEGVTFSGKLSFSPSGTADIYVAIDKEDFGADFAAWESAGATIVEIASNLASGNTFSGKVKVNEAGVYSSRIFAIAGDDITASQYSYGFSLGTKANYPTVYLSSNVVNEVHAKRIYDGTLGNYGDANGLREAVFIFDLKEMKARGFSPAAIRIWPRNGRLDIEKLRGRTPVVSVTSDEIDWPVDSLGDFSSDSRTLLRDLNNTHETANWTVVEDLSWTQMDFSPLCYDVAIPKKLSTTAKYLMVTNITMGHARELEIRTLNYLGSIIIIH